MLNFRARGCERRPRAGGQIPPWRGGSAGTPPGAPLSAVIAHPAALLLAFFFFPRHLAGAAELGFALLLLPGLSAFAFHVAMPDWRLVTDIWPVGSLGAQHKESTTCYSKYWMAETTILTDAEKEAEAEGSKARESAPAK